jgi:hypothetical protein
LCAQALYHPKQLLFLLPTLLADLLAPKAGQWLSLLRWHDFWYHYSRLLRGIVANEFPRRHQQTRTLMGQLIFHRPDQTLDQMKAIRYLLRSRRPAIASLRINTVTIPANHRHSGMFLQPILKGSCGPIRQ